MTSMSTECLNKKEKCIQHTPKYWKEIRIMIINITQQTAWLQKPHLKGGTQVAAPILLQRPPSGNPMDSSGVWFLATEFRVF